MKLRKLSKVHKRLLSGILSAAMVLSGLPALGGSTAHAATILQDETISTDYTKTGTEYGDPAVYDSGESTAYVVGNEPGPSSTTNRRYNSARSATFNISAVKTAASRTDAKAGYNLDVITGYKGNISVGNWWHSRYAFGTETQVTPSISWSNSTPASTSITTDVENRLKNFPANVGNGKVVELTDPNNTRNKVEVRRSVKISDDEQYVIVEYTVHNKSVNSANAPTRVDFWIGNETDTMLHQSDDCPIIVTEQTGAGDKDQGITMFASHGEPAIQMPRNTSLPTLNCLPMQVMISSV